MISAKSSSTVRSRNRQETGTIHLFTPVPENDQANVESKNSHTVGEYEFYYRYDTPKQAKALA